MCHLAHTYVPFGWAPKSCIGALLGSHQLLLLLHLFATRFQWQLTEPTALSITMTALPQPANFRVHLQHRTQLTVPISAHLSEQLSAPSGPNPAEQPRHTDSAATGCPFGHPKQTASQPVAQEPR